MANHDGDALRSAPVSEGPPPSAPRDPRGEYEQSASTYGRAEAEAHRRSVRLSNVRGGVFLALGAAFVVIDAAEGALERVAIVAAVLLALGFAWLVVLHRRARREVKWYGARARIAREGVARMDRDWAALAASLPPGERAGQDVSIDHPFAADLDVIGDASLTRLLGPVTSETGRALLRGWLLNPMVPAESLARQGAVAELAGMSQLRSEFTARARLDGTPGRGALEPFLGWAEEGPWILDRTWLRVISFVSPALLVAGAVGDLFFGAPPWWLLPAAVQLSVLPRFSGWARGAFDSASSGRVSLAALVAPLAMLEGRRWSDVRLRHLAERLGTGPQAARVHLKSLLGLLDTVESRGNVVYGTLAPMLLLDVHLGVSLDRWRREHGASVRDWLDALGEWEALSALATLAHDQPDWVFPRFSAAADPRLEAVGLGHPLLRPGGCVSNDVVVGPTGTFLLVTGSNMSGKSTLLRAIGANVVLAGAGAPVCARSLTLPPLRLRTSMRIDDSLAEGVSLFMAELLRVRGIVKAAREPGSSEAPLLYLLDEILHGTNTSERRVAARAVVRHLLASPAIGAVSTHDLTLADAPDLRKAAVAVHLREEVERPVGPDGVVRLSFDYLVRPGLATTRNALELMRAVGLGDLDLDADADSESLD